MRVVVAAVEHHLYAGEPDGSYPALRLRADERGLQLRIEGCVGYMDLGPDATRSFLRWLTRELAREDAIEMKR